MCRTVFPLFGWLRATERLVRDARTDASQGTDVPMWRGDYLTLGDTDPGHERGRLQLVIDNEGLKGLPISDDFLVFCGPRGRSFAAWHRITER